MEKLKELHLKHQALFPRESRLYLEIPRYGKDNLEYFINMLQYAVDYIKKK